MTIGPVQMLVIGFEGDRFTGEILAELDRLRDQEVARLIDLLFVRHNEDDSLDVLQRSDLSPQEATQFGAILGALVGLGAGGEAGAEAGAQAGAEALAGGHVFDDDDVWYVANVIPPGGSAAVALIEHRWAIPLRDAIIRAGGMALADEWVHPSDLVAAGLAGAGGAGA